MMKKYFDTFAEMKKYREKIGEERILDYGKRTIMGELKYWVLVNRESSMYPYWEDTEIKVK